VNGLSILEDAKDSAGRVRAAAHHPLAQAADDVHQASRTAHPAARPERDALLPLAQAAGRGSPEAVNALVVSLGSAVLSTVRKVLGRNHPDVEDVTQDALVALVTSLRGFRGECTVAHFAHRVALLTAMAARRRLRTRDRFTEFDTPAEAVEDLGALSPLMTAIASRRRAIMRELLDELSDPIAEALALHFVLGYTVEEIALTAALSPHTVWSRLRLGTDALRKRLLKDARLLELQGARE
jgi:RNA polymerase sigma factor (sigma-70 family)